MHNLTCRLTVSKRHIEIENFHSKTERGIKQEIYAHILLISAWIKTL